MANRRVQVAEAKSILEKRFRRLRPLDEGAPPVSADLAHPMIVIHDLRAGSLASLDLYLKQNGSIPDREVALELRKLLTGTSKRSRFRIIAIEHPDGPPPKRGRPRKVGGKPSGKQITLASALQERIRIERKVDMAAAAVAADHKVSVATVHRAARAVSRYAARRSPRNNKRSTEG